MTPTIRADTPCKASPSPPTHTTAAAAATHAPHTSRLRGPEDLMRFPWEEAATDRPKAPRMTIEERRKLMDELSAKWNEGTDD